MRKAETPKKATTPRTSPQAVRSKTPTGRAANTSAPPPAATAAPKSPRTNSASRLRTTDAASPAQSSTTAAAASTPLPRKGLGFGLFRQPSAKKSGSTTPPAATTPRSNSQSHLRKSPTTGQPRSSSNLKGRPVATEISSGPTGPNIGPRLDSGIRFSRSAGAQSSLSTSSPSRALAGEDDAFGKLCDTITFTAAGELVGMSEQRAEYDADASDAIVGNHSNLGFVASSSQSRYPGAGTPSDGNASGGLLERRHSASTSHHHRRASIEPANEYAYDQDGGVWDDLPSTAHSQNGTRDRGGSTSVRSVTPHQHHQHHQHMQQHNEDVQRHHQKELAEVNKRLQNALADVESVRQELIQAKSGADTSAHRLKYSEGEVRRLQHKVSTLEKELKNAQADAMEQHSARNNLKIELADITAENEELRHEVLSASTSQTNNLQQQQMKLLELQNRFVVLEADLTAKQHQIHALQIENDKLKRHKQFQREQETTQGDVRIRLHSSERQLVNLQDILEKSKHSLKEKDTALIDYRTEVSALRQEIDRLRGLMIKAGVVVSAASIPATTYAPQHDHDDLTFSRRTMSIAPGGSASPNFGSTLHNLDASTRYRGHSEFLSSTQRGRTETLSVDPMSSSLRAGVGIGRKRSGSAMGSGMLGPQPDPLAGWDVALADPSRRFACIETGHARELFVIEREALLKLILEGLTAFEELFNAHRVMRTTTTDQADRALRAYLKDAAKNPTTKRGTSPPRSPRTHTPLRRTPQRATTPHRNNSTSASVSPRSPRLSTVAAAPAAGGPDPLVRSPSPMSRRASLQEAPVTMQEVVQRAALAEEQQLAAAAKVAEPWRPTNPVADIKEDDEPLAVLGDAKPRPYVVSWYRAEGREGLRAILRSVNVYSPALENALLRAGFNDVISFSRITEEHLLDLSMTAGLRLKVLAAVDDLNMKMRLVREETENLFRRTYAVSEDYFNSASFSFSSETGALPTLLEDLGETQRGHGDSHALAQMSSPPSGAFLKGNQNGAHSADAGKQGIAATASVNALFSKMQDWFADVKVAIESQTEAVDRILSSTTLSQNLLQQQHGTGLGTSSGINTPTISSI